MFKPERFEAWLAGSGYRSEFVADRLGCSRQMYYQKKNGKSKFTAQDAAELFKLGMTTEEFQFIFGK